MSNDLLKNIHLTAMTFHTLFLALCYNGSPQDIFILCDLAVIVCLMFFNFRYAFRRPLFAQSVQLFSGLIGFILAVNQNDNNANPRMKNYILIICAIKAAPFVQLMEAILLTLIILIFEILAKICCPTYALERYLRNRAPLRRALRQLQTLNLNRTEEICSICFDDLNGKCKQTTCGHKFHEGCLRMWVLDAEQPHNSCPNCRQPLIAVQETRVDQPPQNSTTPFREPVESQETIVVELDQKN